MGLLGRLYGTQDNNSESTSEKSTNKESSLIASTGNHSDDKADFLNLGDTSKKNKDSSTRKRSSNLLSDKELALRDKLQKKIVQEYKDIDADAEDVAYKIDKLALEVVKKDIDIFEGVDRGRVVNDIVNDITGYGIITPFLLDDTISEIMINGYDTIYVEKSGKLILTDVQFMDNDHVMSLIEKIVAPLGRRIDESSPMVDARLKDGSRVNAIIPPVALNGPTVTIRKFPKNPLTINDLIKFGTLSKEMAMFLKACVLGKLNIFISGGTSSGKTSSLNIISGFIPEDERIITIEDAAELRLSQVHVVSWESKPPNMEGKGEISIRMLLKNALRARPDRIIVGEVRGGEALDLLQAMNTGHDGSMGTGHSNSPRDMIARLETMVLMGGVDLPLKAIRQQIASSIDLIIQQSRLKDGTRKITNITEVQGLEGDTVVLQDIFIFKQHGIDENGKIIGALEPTGVRPKFYDKIENAGIVLPPDIFTSSDMVNQG